MNTTEHATSHAIETTLAATGSKATYTGAGMAVSYDDIVRLFSAVDVSEQSPAEALDRLGLAMAVEDSTP